MVFQGCGKDHVDDRHDHKQDASDQVKRDRRLNEQFHVDGHGSDFQVL
jgi:hypothetical protein